MHAELREKNSVMCSCILKEVFWILKKATIYKKYDNEPFNIMIFIFFSTNDQHYYFEILPTLLDHFDIIKSIDGNAFG